MTKEKYDRVGIAIGDTVASSKGATIGTWLGRIAKSPVQRNIGRVKDGSLAPLEMYVGSKKIDESESTIKAIYEKGYLVPRKYVGRSGTSLLMTTWPVILQVTMRTSPTVG